MLHVLQASEPAFSRDAKGLKTQKSIDLAILSGNIEHIFMTWDWYAKVHKMVRDLLSYLGP